MLDLPLRSPAPAMGPQSLHPTVPPSSELAVLSPASPHAASPGPRPLRWNVVRRHALLVIAAGAVAAGAAAAALRFVDPVYESAASVRVEVKQANLPEVYQRVVTGDQVGNEVDLLSSRSLAERVVDSLGLRVQFVRPAAARAGGLVASVRATRGTATDSGSYTFRRAGAGFAVLTGKPERQVAVARVGEPVQLAGATIVLAPRALAEPRIDLRVGAFGPVVEELRDALPVERAGRESQVIWVSYRSTDPTLARDVPNVAVAHFLDMRRRGRQLEATKTAAALRDQIRTISRQLAVSDSTLRDFRERGRVIDPRQEGTAQIARVAQLRSDRVRLSSERDALASLMHALDARARATPGEALSYRQIGGFPTLKDNEVVGSYVRALTSVEEQRAALLVRRTPEDPDVQALTSRAQTLAEQLRNSASAYLDGISRQTVAIDTELGRTERDLARIPGQEAEYARLERGPKVLGEMLTLLQTRLKEAEVAQAVVDPSVQQLDAATLPTRAVRPRPVRDIGLAACAGLLLGLVGVVTRERLDRTVRSRDDVREWARLPVIGIIPHASRNVLRGGPAAGRAVPAAGRRALLSATRSAGETNRLMLLEAFARLQTRVAMQHPGGRLRTLAVTSPLSGEGKTTTAGSLAGTVARTGLLTLVIDGDLRRGTLHHSFGVPRAPGLAEVLAGEAGFDDVVRHIDVGDGLRLAVIPAGGPVDPTRRLLTAARAREVLAMATARFDSVVIDAPPLNLTADAAVLATEADGVLLVARAGGTPLEALARAAQQLAETQATTLGVVMNGIDPIRDSAYDTEYRYYADPYFEAASV